MCVNDRHQEGFTLLEVLIAIVITAMIGLGAWQILNSAIRASELTQVSIERLAQMQKAMLFISRDLQQVVARSVRDEYGDYQPAVKSGGEFYKIQFSRLGWRNPLQDPRSDLQRVAYEYSNGELIRHYWQVLDRSQDSESSYRKLLDDVESIEFRYMNDSGGWLDKWPPSNTSGATVVDRMLEHNQLPKAIEVRLVHKQFGDVRRLFDLPQYVAHEDISGSSGSSAGSGSSGGAGTQGGGN